MKCQEIQKQISKRLWDKEEDQLLLDVVAKFKVIKWSQVAEEFNKITTQLNAQNSSHLLSKRTNKQCRERWQNHLNPQLRNDLPWLPEQRSLLFKLFKQYSHQWCRISEQLAEGGFAKRGDNNIKNYFYSAIKRAIRQINTYIQNHNRNIKKRKSQLYNYHQKYAYKKRLSLERQIIEANVPLIRNNEETIADSVEGEELKIIRELDQDIINKILLIAELKGEKKFTVTKEEFQADACILRNTIIDFLEDQTTLNSEQAVVFARNLLQISRKCKRKAQKITKDTHPSEALQLYLTDSQMMKQQEGQRQNELNDFNDKISVEVRLKKSAGQNELLNNKPFNEKEILEKLMLNEEEKPNKPPATIPNNQAEEHSNFFQNAYTGTSEAMRSFLEQSSEFLYNSGQYSQYSQKYAGIPQYNFDHLTFGQGDLKSLNFGEMIDSREVKNTDPARIMDREEACSNMAQFNFLSSIREIKPVNNMMESQAFDFDIGTPAGSFVPHSYLRHDMQLQQPSGSEQDRPHFFSSQAYLQNRESGSHHSINSRRSNNSKRSVNSRRTKKEGQREEQGGLELLGSQQLLRRSWAYSQNRGEGRGCLFNSSDYQIKHEFPMDLKISSNFHPFQ